MGEAKRRGSRELRIGEAIHRELMASIKREEELRMRALVWQKDHEKRLKEAEGKTVFVTTPPRPKPDGLSWLKIGGRYNWKGQPERLIYLGHNFSGNGYWHQFAKVESPDVIWSEILSSDLHMIEPTVEK